MSTTVFSLLKKVEGAYGELTADFTVCSIKRPGVSGRVKSTNYLAIIRNEYAERLTAVKEQPIA